MTLLQCLRPPCGNRLLWCRVDRSSHPLAAFRSVRSVDDPREVVDVHRPDSVPAQYTGSPILGPSFRTSFITLDGCIGVPFENGAPPRHQVGNPAQFWIGSGKQFQVRVSSCVSMVQRLGILLVIVVTPGSRLSVDNFGILISSKIIYFE